MHYDDIYDIDHLAWNLLHVCLAFHKRNSLFLCKEYFEVLVNLLHQHRYSTVPVIGRNFFVYVCCYVVATHRLFSARCTFFLEVGERRNTPKNGFEYQM